MNKQSEIPQQRNIQQNSDLKNIQTNMSGMNMQGNETVKAFHTIGIVKEDANKWKSF